jgi:SAM-dependent methyltransferase
VNGDAAPGLAAELDAIRESYDTVAADYADLLRGNLAGQPHDRAVLGLFAELVADTGGGAVADVGCGPGRITAHLAGLGVDAFGTDLSPAMIETARRDHPDLRFEVGSMTDLDLPDGSLAGLLGWYSLIHLPDEAIPGVLAHFHRVLRPGGLVLLAFHVGDDSRLKTEGYGGHPMRLVVHRRPPERVAGWLADAGLLVDTRVVREPEGVETVPQAYLLARKPADAATRNDAPA